MKVRNLPLAAVGQQDVAQALLHNSHAATRKDYVNVTDLYPGPRHSVITPEFPEVLLPKDQKAVTFSYVNVKVYAVRLSVQGVKGVVKIKLPS